MLTDNIDLNELSIGGNGKITYYDGSDDIPNLITRLSIIESDDFTQTIRDRINKKCKICFMPIDVYEDNTNEYTLCMYGVLINGSKVEVRLTGLEPFVDVIVPNGMDHNSLQFYLSDMINRYDNRIHFQFKNVTAYSLHEYANEPRMFKRIITTNTWHRSNIIKALKDLPNIELYSNDSSHYYRKAARENKISLSDWSVLSEYEYENGEICEYIFTLDYKNYTRLEKLRDKQYIKKDKTMIMAWDIETYSSDKKGDLPVGEKDTDVAFMICLSFHWLHEADALFKVCIVDKETESDSRWHTIICNDHINVIKAMAICWNKLKPDIVIGYNDSGYDWPFIMEKCIKHSLVDWFWKRVSCLGHKYGSDYIIKKYYNNKEGRMVKINAERIFVSKCLMVPGSIPIDCLPCYMKLYPRLDENKYGSLKFYLNDNLLPTKVDLPIPTLWKYYESGNPKQMREIAYYCIVDTISVQRLFIKRSIITDYREIATLAYVSLSDAHYYAGGVKVRNLLGAYAWQSGILVNMCPSVSKAEKYPGAYVFPPDKGITPNMKRLKDLHDNPNKEEAIMNFANDRPVSCLDFASLYPNIIITYNLSPEKIILTKEQAESHLKERCEKLHPIKFSIDDRPIQAWSVMHENDESKMGLFPIILKNLFAKRKEMKNLLKSFSDKKEMYELIFSKVNKCNLNNSKPTIELYRTCTNNTIESFNNDIQILESEVSNTDLIIIPSGSDLTYEIGIRNNRIRNIKDMLKILEHIKNNINTIQTDYDNICFERNCIDKKQNALKIYMNTFYGETGNHRSPFYVLQLAGGVTSAGQYNITLASKIAERKGFNVKYGDSIMPYTPLIIKDDTGINIVTVDSFTGWYPYEEFKREDSNRFEKQQIKLCNSYIWTHKGFARIRRVIRHKTNKIIYRVITNSGLVDVTEDHSLLDVNCNIIKPSKCVIGTSLLHSKPIINQPINNSVKFDTTLSENGVITTVSQLLAQKYFIKLQLMNYIVYVSVIDSVYHIEYTRRAKRVGHNEIKNIYIIDHNYTDYVYDIETEHGVFHAGIGNIILKNTDSLYLTCPRHVFKECDYKYINGEYTKLEYFTAMVKITLRVISSFETEINEELAKDNGSRFLKMENEGCNYPCVFLGKKKYFGIQHLNEVNFSPKKLYIKGIEVIKQGKSNLEKEIGNAIMKRAVSLDNDKDMTDIVKDELSRSLDINRWKFEDFIQSSSWKPEKKNITVQNFVKRMEVRREIEQRENELRIKNGQEPKEYLYPKLEPGERFTYVYIKNDILYDLRGRKRCIKASDIMEFADVAKKLDLKIDIIYYLIHYVLGTCARFISFDDQFLPSGYSNLDDKQKDEVSIKNAKSYLEEYINRQSGLSKKIIAQQGIECKRIYKNAVQEYTNGISHVYRSLVEPISKIAFDDAEKEIDIIFNCVDKHVQYLFKKYYKNYCDDTCKLLNINSITGNNINTTITNGNSLYRYVGIKNNRILDNKEDVIRNKLRSFPLQDLTIHYKTCIEEIVRSNSVNITSNTDTFDSFNKIWNELVAIKLCKYKHERLITFLTDLKYKKNKMVKNPSRSDIVKIVTESANNIFNSNSSVTF